MKCAFELCYVEITAKHGRVYCSTRCGSYAYSINHGHFSLEAAKYSFYLQPDDPLVCQVCGKTFDVKKHSVRPRLYCSTRCRKRAALMRMYGRKPEDYKKILEKQDYSCGLCGVKATSFYSLQIDHNHNTGKVRGLLCSSCNSSLGWFENRKLIITSYSEIEEVDI